MTGKKERAKPTPLSVLLLRFVVIAPLLGIAMFVFKGTLFDYPLWACMAAAAALMGLGLAIGAVCERVDWP